LTGPGWLAAGLAALMLLIAGSCIVRLALWRHRRPAEPDVDALHAVMGVAMAGMLLPHLSLLPGRVWQALLGIAAAWFAARAIRSRARPASQRPFSHLAPHAVECAAMVYMLIPARGTTAEPAAMAGMTAAPFANPVVTLLFTVFLVGYLLWTADQLLARRRAAALAGGARQPTVLGKIAMSVAMGYMLLAML
jgi:hypothetical protein